MDAQQNLRDAIEQAKLVDRSDPGLAQLEEALNVATGQSGGGGPQARSADFRWDWRNRLVECIDVSGTQQTHRYFYDVLGRRVAKQVDADSPGVESRTTRYVYGGLAHNGHWHVLADQRPTPGADGWYTVTSYLIGQSIDEVIHVWRAPRGNRGIGALPGRIMPMSYPGIGAGSSSRSE